MLKNKLALLALALLLSFRPYMAVGQPFGGGTGTANDPYVIATVEHLRELRSRVNDGSLGEGLHFRQSGPLDLKNSPWAVIGTARNPFLCSYDGGGYSIQGLTITGDANYSQGLFGMVGDGEISGTLRGVRIEGVRIAISRDLRYLHAGALAGQVRGPYRVEDCRVTIREITVASLYGGEVWVGGLVGRMENSLGFSDCFAYGVDSTSTVSASSQGLCVVGGLVGGFGNRLRTDGLMERCGSRVRVAISSVYAFSMAGGLSGSLQGVKAHNCYSQANLFSQERKYGGILAGLFGKIRGDARACYSNGSGTHRGRLLPALSLGDALGEYTDCYYWNYFLRKPKGQQEGVATPFEAQNPETGTLPDGFLPDVWELGPDGWPRLQSEK